MTLADIDFSLSLGGLIAGIIVGLTCMGGAALVTQMLVLVFGINPATAVSSDVVAAAIMKPVGSWVHIRNKTVHWGLVAWLSAGSIPGVLVGSYLFNAVLSTSDASDTIKTWLGAVLLLAVAAMVAKTFIAARAYRKYGHQEQLGTTMPVKPVPTFILGATVGLIVGMTSVGSGSLVVTVLLLLYPLLRPSVLVGTDLTQAVPLTMAAALGVVAGLVWQWTHPALHPLHNPDYNANPTLLDRVHWFMQIDNVLPDHVRQMVGVLGSLDTPVPQILVVTFTLAWAATGGLLYARQKVSAVVVMIGFFGIFLLPWVLEFLRWNDWPYWWEGRYALPFAIPFIFIFLLRYGAKGTRAIQALSLVSSFILLFMVWQTFMRYAYGVKDYVPVRWSEPAVGPVPYFGSIIVISLLSSVLVIRIILFFKERPRRRHRELGMVTS